jgi:DNA-3-methyladenine glycosylase
MKRLPSSFFDRDTKVVARELLGKYLVIRTTKGTISGKIVETEAYHENDPASHSYRGKTPRNAPMFGKPGHAYVYFTYGMHWCFNIVTEPDGTAGAVLIRAVEPIQGIDLMRKNRKKQDLRILTNGPAKLTQAFGIDRKFNGKNLDKGPLGVFTDNKRAHKLKIVHTKRVGISEAKQALLRFYIQNNTFVSAI